MAVNIIEIGTVYDALETKIVGTLTTEYDAGRLKGKEYSEVMTAAISALISSSVMSVLEQPLKDAQVLDMKVKDYALLANTQKDIELKDMEIAKASKDALFIDAKINSLGIEDAIKQTQSTADVATKGAQLTLITAQTGGENAKTLLTGRQKEYYDDQKMLKVLDSAANALGMYAAGDTLIPVGLENAFATRITAELA